MPRPPNLQKSLDRLIAYLGAQIAKVVAERVGKSAARPPKTGVRPKRGQKTSKGKYKAKGRKARSAGRARKKPKKCTIRGCNNPARSKGLCSKHYQRARYAALHGKKSGKPRKKISARGAKKAAPPKPENA